MWEKDALNEKLGAEGLDKLSGDALAKNKIELIDGLWMKGNVFDVKRPSSKRSVSGYM